MVHDEVLKIQIAAWPGPQGPQALNVESMEPGWMGSTPKAGFTEKTPGPPNAKESFPFKFGADFFKVAVLKVFSLDPFLIFGQGQRKREREREN